MYGLIDFSKPLDLDLNKYTLGGCGLSLSENTVCAACGHRWLYEAKTTEDE